MRNNSIVFYSNIRKATKYIFIALLTAQIIFQVKTEYIKPNLHIVPKVPSKYNVQALSFGDEEFYFRILSARIQSAGDSFGRVVPLKDYNYEDLYQWFKILDSLNAKSRAIPSIASYYFAQTQKKEDAIYVIKYLRERAKENLNHNWWWLFQAIHISKLALSDDELALEIAYDLSKNSAPDAPLWTKQLPAFLSAKMGRDCEAFFVINRILKDHDSGANTLEETEMDFMRHFIKERLKDFKTNKFDPRKCKRNGKIVSPDILK